MKIETKIFGLVCWTLVVAVIVAAIQFPKERHAGRFQLVPANAALALDTETGVVCNTDQKPSDPALMPAVPSAIPYCQDLK